MKTAKKIKKAHVALAVMIVALGAAVWLNMKYTAAGTEGQEASSSKYLGQAEYVNASVSDVTSEEEEDYFSRLRSDRQAAREDSLAIIEETLDRDDLTDQQRQDALDKYETLALAGEQETAIETVLKAKGFADVVAVIGESDINIIVSGEIDSVRSAQIRDAVFSQTDFSASQIKIITAQ